MAYGYKEWHEEYGETQPDPAKGAIELVLSIIDNLTYPTSGTGTVPLSELSARIQSLSDADDSNESWNSRLKEISDFIGEQEFPAFPGGRIDPKPVVSHLKKLMKGKKEPS
jgi:hypothetical protein